MLVKNHDYYYLAKKNALPDASERDRIYSKVKKGSRVHVAGVCGKAMASVACMLKEYGCVVTGSDTAFFAPMSGVLDAHGIEKRYPSPDNLKGVDIVVVGNTLPHNAVEIVAARTRGIPMISGGEVLGQIHGDKRSLVVAGTHGKTTTSGLLTHVFMASQRIPAYMIGGVFQGSDDSYSMGSKESQFMIYEGDEYNCAFFDRGPKFLRYHPTSAIITSIEHDHVDLYPSFEDYKQAFQFLVEELLQDGVLVVHESTLPYLDLTRCKAKIVSYGACLSCAISYNNMKTTDSGTAFSLQSTDWGTIEKVNIPLFGEYNVANATAVAALSLYEGLSQAELLKALEAFGGTKERQELLGIRSGDIAVIRDYAHHPTAVTVTLEGLKLRYQGRRLIVVFEPRSASSKRKVFEDRYAQSLAHADSVIVVFLPTSSNATEVLDVSRVVSLIVEGGGDAHHTETFSSALELLVEKVRPGDVVVFMSSGDMDRVPFAFLKAASLDDAESFARLPV